MLLIAVIGIVVVVLPLELYEPHPSKILRDAIDADDPMSLYPSVFDV